MNILKTKDIYELEMVSLCIYTITTSFHITLTNISSLLKVITNMLLKQLQIEVSVYKDKNYPMANALAVLMELRFRIKFLQI